MVKTFNPGPKGKVSLLLASVFRINDVDNNISQEERQVLILAEVSWVIDQLYKGKVEAATVLAQEPPWLF